MLQSALSWIPLAALAVVLLTDLPPLVLGAAQRGLLASGLWNAKPPGQPAPVPVSLSRGPAYPHQLPLLSFTGQPLDLSSLRGKVVFVNLWASWCPPCVAEMPGIERLYQKVDKSKVAFVMISLDEQPARAQALLRRRGYTFPVYFPTGPLPAPFNSRSIPSTVILGPGGQVIDRYDGMADYDTPEFRAALENLAMQSES